jgi:hypothetical protein
LINLLSIAVRPIDGFHVNTAPSFARKLDDGMNFLLRDSQMKLKLKARVNPSDARTIRHALEQLSAKGPVRKAGDESLSKSRWKEPVQES